MMPLVRLLWFIALLSCGNMSRVTRVTVVSESCHGICVMQILNNPKYKSHTTLSKYVWKLKEERKVFSLKWKIIDRAPPYNPMTRKCNLCIKEKFYIIYRPNMATLNKRNELFNSCWQRHEKCSYVNVIYQLFLSSIICLFYCISFFIIIAISED